MKIAVAAEADQSEPRVAATPESVKKMIGLGAEVAVQPGAGVKSGMSVADVGAGEGYYTVRLARVVGAKGRVLAEDIVPEVRDALSDPAVDFIFGEGDCSAVRPADFHRLRKCAFGDQDIAPSAGEARFRERFW